MDPRRMILIKIQYDGVEFPLRIPLTATIGNVKEKIYNSTGIPIHVGGQALLYLGQVWLSDENTLQQYGIVNGSVLVLFRRFELTIILPNFAYVWRTVCEDFTVGEVKASLVSDDGVQDIGGTALQMVHDDGHIVTLDDRSYLWAAGIVKDTNLYLVNV